MDGTFWAEAKDKPTLEGLFQRPGAEQLPTGRAGIISWWEAGRLWFNTLIGTVGLASWVLVITVGSAAVEPGEDFVEPIAMIGIPFIYVFVANLCYTLGWIIDTVFFQGRPRVWLYKAGVIFSVVLTALPGIWAVVAWLIAVFTGHKLS